MKKGRGGTMTHDYKRHGTTTLFAALETSSGKVTGRTYRKHRHREVLRFLREVDKAVPADQEIHIVLDNYATHKHDEGAGPGCRASGPVHRGTGYGVEVRGNRRPKLAPRRYASQLNSLFGQARFPASRASLLCFPAVARIYPSTVDLVGARGRCPSTGFRSPHRSKMRRHSNMARRGRDGPFDLDHKVERLTSSQYEHDLKRIDWLYRALGVLDVKAIGLLTVNAILMAVLSVVATSRIVDQLIPRCPFLESSLPIALVLIGLVLLSSSVLHVLVLKIGWPILGRAVCDADGCRICFTEELRSLSGVVERRTLRFRCGWRLTLIALPLTMGLGIFLFLASFCQ